VWLLLNSFLTGKTCLDKTIFFRRNFMKKKTLSFLIVLILSFSIMAMTALAGGKTEPSGPKQGVQGFTIGFPKAPVENAVIIAMEKNRAAVAEACGGKLITEIFDFTPEGTIDAVEKLIQAGVKGVLVTPFAQSIMPSISRMCQDAGVYFILSMRKLTDPDVKRIVEANPYYLGAVYEDDYNTGYSLGKAFANAGGKNYALIGTVAGDTTGDERERGLAEAAREFGLTKLAEVRAYTQASDATASVESFIASYPNLDGIIRVASTAAGDVSAIATTLKNSNRASGRGKFIFCSCDVEEGCETYLEDGSITMGLGDALVNDSVTASVILCNAIMGTPLSGKPVDIALKLPSLESISDFQMQMKYVTVETPLYTTDDIRKNFIKYYTPDVTIDSVIALAKAYSPAAIAKRRGM
jgi:ABC-type sugar transport system substrate-binding protein